MVVRYYSDIATAKYIKDELEICLFLGIEVVINTYWKLFMIVLCWVLVNNGIFFFPDQRTIFL